MLVQAKLDTVLGLRIFLNEFFGCVCENEALDGCMLTSGKGMVNGRQTIDPLQPLDHRPTAK